MHVVWQIKQTVTIDGQRHVDRCNNSGNRGAARIWTFFMGLVAWIAINMGVESNVYIDDNFSVELADDIDFNEPYEDFFPAAQVKTLCLWDEIGLNQRATNSASGLGLTSPSKSIMPPSEIWRDESVRNDQGYPNKLGQKVALGPRWN
ncbi:hypothetical protein B0H13DRAFT_2303492 [Mycena leptocephala]|nr:hypothetical protein B0H13DRAFT_2303492 [Mycena leptocephala]